LGKTINLVMKYRELNDERIVRERLTIARAVPEFNDYLNKLLKQLHSVYVQIQSAYIDFIKKIVGADGMLAVIFLDEYISYLILQFITLKLSIEDDCTKEVFQKEFQEYIHSSKLPSLPQKILVHPDATKIIFDFLAS